ncbi:MAG: virulence protein RhuM/Fic/DOC family protein [Desulfobulbaceae bacterium]|nr:virulence protein RhuM/Fic/DOC family protein [Desulfobulbaceae bacterium]
MNQEAELGEIILYQSDDGEANVDVHFRDETVWLSQKQMAELFAKDVRTINEHVKNIYREKEMSRDSTIRKFRIVQNEGGREVTRQIDHYNLDVIISVGYRVKSQRGTQFRIWATSVLKDHLVKGYTLNQRRLAEKGTEEVQQVLSLLTNTLAGHDLVNDEGRGVLDIVNRYAKTWQLLLQYDEDTLSFPKHAHEVETCLELPAARSAILSLKKDLAAKGEATELFGHEREHGLESIVGAIHQTFGGHDLYPGIILKAAHLLYFVIKDHPFSDGNKRIGTFLFLLFLRQNNKLDRDSFSNNALVALALLTAASDPEQKEILIKLIVNLISDEN